MKIDGPSKKKEQVEENMNGSKDKFEEVQYIQGIGLKWQNKIQQVADPTQLGTKLK